MVQPDPATTGGLVGRVDFFGYGMDNMDISRPSRRQNDFNSNRNYYASWMSLRPQGADQAHPIVPRRFWSLSGGLALSLAWGRIAYAICPGANLSLPTLVSNVSRGKRERESRAPNVF